MNGGTSAAETARELKCAARVLAIPAGKRFLPRCAFALAFVLAACGRDAHREGPIEAQTPSVPASQTPPAAQTHDEIAVAPPPSRPDAVLACLTRLYGTGWQTSVVWDRGKARSLEQRLEDPDLKDLFAEPYPTGPVPTTLPSGDPGRTRVYAILDAYYGAPGPALAKKLVTVAFAGTRIAIHPQVKEPLAKVDARLKKAQETTPKFAKFLRDLGGTYNDRVIAGTTRASAHAYGIAIDLSVPESAYWRNVASSFGPAVSRDASAREFAGARERTGPRYSNRFPQEIVDAFEAEGFIWGGRWAHFDTMHFEYRPEYFDPECGASQSPPRTH